MADLSMESLLKLMVQNQGSDLFLSVGAPPAMKIDGEMKRFKTENLSPEDTDHLAREILDTEQAWEEFRAKGGANLALSYENVGRFRANVFRQRHSVGMVIRRINTQVPSFEELGLPEALKDIASYNRGLVFVIGATGSGKSTTLASMIDYRNRNQAGHILTLEDPIEFIHEHKKSLVNQREIGMDAEDWESALNDALRQAPDVVLVGEIRNRDSMEHALHLADTGHLTLATLHSTNAAQTLDRIRNMFPEDRHSQILQDISLNLRAIVGQRLARRPEGGRAGVLEVFVNTPRAADFIIGEQFGALKDVMEEDQQFGMQSFDEAATALYKEGKIDAEEAMRQADSANNVRIAIKNFEREQQGAEGEGEDEGPEIPDFEIQDQEPEGDKDPE
ncbi:PilT/PilU family type 4a pilus ATPase [Thiohalorhabdus methylotrophus]|uniref:PilT/PilU family type 4a pilus ATPase n=1 Tax=Thiohalorhabdus methylotrophus TaxID=3242694 RepID=A0ABV4TXZ1_9GAMM